MRADKRTMARTNTDKTSATGKADERKKAKHKRKTLKIETEKHRKSDESEIGGSQDVRSWR